ncbi:protein FAM76A-like isoform X1 [Amphibalanus amphitrite]|uniref:protein FAM76A-like isoform X1 n=1 Tax=Amphibalanus amphitrite TaxID=1232801 RepID=UPI001C9091A8|nr:protein FAM76A-like isoform X1 [Amphibalanus amphitrite]
MSDMLFACSRCFSRHPFEELSQGQQLCKECRGSFPVVKCTYCRSEFQQESKGSTSTICKKCEQMVKAHGKPTACDYCNVIAAFIGSRCQRCANSEKRYGPPQACEQCKQKCAFDRKDPEDKKKVDAASGAHPSGSSPDQITVDGKLLCWLCTLSYKRALAKTKSTDPARHTHVKLGKNQEKRKPKYYVSKRPDRPDVTRQPLEGSEPKKARKDEQSDHVVAMTQLREEIASLQRQLQLKNQQMLGKDKEICELKAKNLRNEQDIRRKMNDQQKAHEAKVETLQGRIRSLSKEVAALSKRSKAGGGSALASADSASNSPLV